MDHITISLALEESDTGPVKARAKFSLLDLAGKPVLYHSSSTGLKEYPIGGAGWGISNFIKREFLENSGHLKDDCFKIRCDVIIPQKICTEDREATPFFIDVSTSDIFRQLGDLLSSKDGADVMFPVGGKTFWAHRCILGARSPVFKAEFFGAMRESVTTGDHIQIDDILPQVFEALLDFIYTDSLPEMEGQEEAVMRLKLICEDKLCRHLDVSTVATTLVLAEQHNCQGLKEACIEFLKSSDALEAVMETDGFDHLAKSCPALIKELLLKLATCSRKKKLRSEDRRAHAPFVVVPPSDLNQHLGNLFVAEDGADVTFQVAGRTFKAHRFLLAARSPVFKAELLGGMKESRAIADHIQIDDILPQVFETLLHFVYNDSLPEMEGEEEAMMAQHLLEAADRYDMQRLKLICEDKLCRHLDVSTVATTLVLAEQHNCQGLKEACIEFLKSSDALEAVMETDGFDHMAKSCPALMKELMLKLVTRPRKRKSTE
ncbi:hypothetical protein HU200_049246 [Digitaria exilis]|uniref:Uncharacterized protein n=1 Tax=Digitaria exilis TaxID=1010633 RepID=A0A835EA36_9POAL|nr:hypothetical protein HU200_049246 [Digitaria exilis]